MFQVCMISGTWNGLLRKADIVLTSRKLQSNGGMKIYMLMHKNHKGKQIALSEGAKGWLEQKT